MDDAIIFSKREFIHGIDCTVGKGVASSKKRWCPVGPLNNQLGVRGAL